MSCPVVNDPSLPDLRVMVCPLLGRIAKPQWTVLRRPVMCVANKDLSRVRVWWTTQSAFERPTISMIVPFRVGTSCAVASCASAMARTNDNPSPTPGEFRELSTR